ncbi:MAG TPA: prolipoprotein diacylglyceryl transferase [Candidatus Binatia bacterium]|nr:prolipoprotein diacylglyceryl transferase [Candidatus Binatia bacterium]
MIDWTPDAVALQIGPFSLYWYGIAYAVGLAGAYLVMVRMAQRLRQNPGIIGNGLIIVAVAALIGGRLYHVIDQWHLYASDPIRIVLPPYSGLGIFGGFITGAIAVIVLTRYHKVSFWRWADIVAPGIFVMQAAGRVGNFFNQELYGPPTDLPWGIAIDCEHRVIEYPCSTFPLAETHFHPLFLYESLSGLLGAVVLLWLATRPRPWLRVGDLAGIMLIWIGGVRFLVEFLRIGNWRIGDIPTAQIFGAAFVLVGIGILVYRRAVRAPALVPPPGESAADEWQPPEGGEGDDGGRTTMTGAAQGAGSTDDDVDDFAEFDAAQAEARTTGRAPRAAAPWEGPEADADDLDADDFDGHVDRSADDAPREQP